MKNLKSTYQIIVLVLFILSLNACAISDKQQKQWADTGSAFLNTFNKKTLTKKDIAAGLKEALKVGSERVVSQVGKRNGYLNDKAIHIALPSNLQKAHNTLNKIGLGRYTKELETKMNRAAELAAPKAKKIFYSAIKDIRWRDVQSIYNGKNDAATQYFKRKMTPALKVMMKPIIEKTLSQAGVVQAYKHALKQYYSIPFVPRVKSDINGYVINKSINGLFYYLAKEEAAIRKDPAKRTTELLRRVFSK